MNLELNNNIEELEEKIRLLTAENENLTSRAEEIYLLSLVSESVHGISDRKEIIETVLEKISILKDIPFCGYGKVKKNNIQISISYVSYADKGNNFAININDAFINKIEEGILFLKTPDQLAKKFIEELSSPQFKPKSLLLIPYKSESKGLRLYVFADEDENYNRLRNMSIMLQEAIHGLNTRLENLFLVNQLKELTLTLEKRISKRTSELWEANNLLREQIKERQKKEDELRIRNDELNNFVYRVSHDLRAPITSIEGLINIIKLEDMDHKSSVSDYIGMLEDRVKNLDRFIRDILSYSRNINTSIKTDHIDFESIISNCFDELTYLDGVDSMERIISIKGGAYYNDKIRIYEVFRNLISNAVKYSKLAKKDSWVKINIEVHENKALIQIKDNGIGISSSALPNIFEMFYRGSEDSKGSGIGLYIVKQAIEKLGGKIAVSSQLKKGTEFNIEIPNNKLDSL